MVPLKAGLVALALGALAIDFTTCRSPGEAGKEPTDEPAQVIVELPGVDTKQLTSREKGEWSKLVSELLAPCPDQPVSLAACVKEKRKCETCKPATEFLAKQVTRGATRTQAEQAFRTRFAPDEVKTVDIEGSPFKGKKDAVVTIVEWADFECPYCGAVAPLLNNTVKKYPDHVKVVFKNYPLTIHKHALGAARASVAAQKQGKFWEMHALLFANGSQLSDDFTPFAKQLNLDLKQFKKDFESEETADRVTADKKQADKLDLQGTPLIYINGRNFSGGPFRPAEDLDPWIQLEIKLRTGQDVKPKKIDEDEGAAPIPSSATPAGSGSAAPAGSQQAPEEKKAPTEKKAPAEKKAPEGKK